MGLISRVSSRTYRNVMIFNRIFRSWKRLQQSQKRYTLLFFLSGAGLFIHFHKEAILNYQVDNVVKGRRRLPPTDYPENGDLVPPDPMETIHHKNNHVEHEPNPDNDENEVETE